MSIAKLVLRSLQIHNDELLGRLARQTYFARFQVVSIELGIEETQPLVDGSEYTVLFDVYTVSIRKWR